MLIIWRKKISDFFYIPSVGEAKNYRHPTILVALFRTSNKFVNFSGIFCHRKMFHTILESDLMRMGTQIPDLFGHPALLHGIVSLFFLLSFECFFSPGRGQRGITHPSNPPQNIMLFMMMAVMDPKPRFGSKR